MSLHDYKTSIDLVERDLPFYGLIMAAMSRADVANAQRLRDAFPATWAELEARYDAPGGVLASDPPAGSIQ